MAYQSISNSLELIENNKKFMLFRFRGSREQLILTGIFNGDEEYIRLTKGKLRYATIFYKDGRHYTHEYGEESTYITNMGTEEGRIIKTVIDIVQKDWDTMLADDSGKTIITNKKELQGHEVQIILKRTNTLDVFNVYKDGFYLGKMYKPMDYINENFNIIEITDKEDDTKSKIIKAKRKL